MRAFDLGIIGGGIIGASAAWHAARRGASVVLIDQACLPNPRGASVDHSKVFRYAYPAPLYVRLAVEAHVLWRELEREAGRSLLTATGLVVLDDGGGAFASACCDALGAQGCEAVRLTSTETRERWPQFAGQAFSHALFDPSGAILRAEEAVRATLELARRAGATVVEHDQVLALHPGGGLVTERAGRIATGRTLVAAGPWARTLIPELATHLRVTRQEVWYFEPHNAAEFSPARFPIFLDVTSGFYGFPVHHGRALKIANHQKGPVADPRVPAATPADESAAREFFRRFLPALADARAVESRVCYYNNTRDDDFIIDWLPGRPDVLVATGFSGHGFKFGPLIGRIAADLAATGATAPLGRFRWGRLEGTGS